MPFFRICLITKTTRYKPQQEDTQVDAKQANGPLEGSAALFYDLVL